MTRQPLCGALSFAIALFLSSAVYSMDSGTASPIERAQEMDEAVAINGGSAERVREGEFLRAAECGDEKLLRDLLAQGVNSEAKGDLGHTALHLAIAHGHRDLINLLLENSVDVNAQSNGGWTPLLMAIDRAETELVAALLTFGADANLGAEDGWTPLKRAVMHSPRWSAGERAFVWGHMEIVAHLVSAGADPFALIAYAQQKHGQEGEIVQVLTIFSDAVRANDAVYSDKGESFVQARSIPAPLNKALVNSNCGDDTRE